MGSDIFNSIPNGSDRVFKISIVCGWDLDDTKKVFLFGSRVVLKNMSIASAAAVPSSSKDEFANGSPVRSETIVWKFNNASKRP